MPALSYCPRCLTTFREVGAEACPNLSCGLDRPEDGWGAVLQEGDLIDRHYRIARVLAVGGAGLTYLAREIGADDAPVGPELAVKVLYSARASGSYLRRLATEAQILQELAHDNIVECRGFVHRAGHEPYLVTLFEHGGSLGQHVSKHGPLEARVAAGIVRQVLMALDTAHQRGVVHRDLKPDNVLLSAVVESGTIPHVRVADFGIAKVVGGLSSHQTKHGAFVGTPEYAAPEQFEQRAPTAATDIFACGGLLYFTLTGRPPVSLSRRADIETSYEEVLDQVPPVLTDAEAPLTTAAERDALNRLLAEAMAVRPEHRATAQQVIAALRPLLDPDATPLGTGTLEITREPPPSRSRMPATPTFAVVPDEEVAVVAPEPPPEALPDPGPVSDDGIGAPPTLQPEPESAPPVPARTSEPAPARAAGGVFAALFGLAGGAMALLVAVAVGAGALWILSSGPADRQPEPAPFDPATAPVATGSARLAIQKMLQAPARSVGRACKVGGPVVLTVVTEPDGTLHEARVDPGWLPSDGATCVGVQVQALSAPTSDVGYRARIALDLGAP